MQRTIEGLLDIGQFAEGDVREAILKENVPCQRLALLGQLLASCVLRGEIPDECIISAIYVSSRDHLNNVFEAGGMALRLGGKREFEGSPMPVLN